MFIETSAKAGHNVKQVTFFVFERNTFLSFRYDKAGAIIVSFVVLEFPFLEC